MKQTFNNSFNILKVCQKGRRIQKFVLLLSELLTDMTVNNIILSLMGYCCKMKDR